MDSKRIAVVTETWPPEVNGVAMTLKRLVDGLALRHRVELVRPRQDHEYQGDVANVEHVLVTGLPLPGYRGLRLGLPSTALLHGRWRARRPDLVHVVTEGPLGAGAIRVARQLAIPVTSDFHTNFHHYSRHYGLGWLRPLVGGYLRRLHNRCDRTLVPSESLRRELDADGYRNLAVVGRGVDTGLFNPARRSLELRRSWDVLDDEPVVLYVGRVAAEKNLRLANRAFQRIREYQPDARMVWVGDGPERRRLEKALPGHVFVGMKRGEDLARHYASGDIFLMPSLTETFGNTVLEAMASGLAVLAYHYAAAEIHIRSGENGMTVPAGDARAYLKAAESLAVSLEQTREMGRRAHEDVRAVTWERISAQFEAMLLSAIEAGQASTGKSLCQAGMA
jgi:glycosyltransferase involved in cell wall biosynthesis